jgi:hypothetical protein
MAESQTVGEEVVSAMGKAAKNKFKHSEPLFVSMRMRVTKIMLLLSLHVKYQNICSVFFSFGL